ncbi:hypothetical protein M8C21_018500, partial [Ambrosia artemisiifolia]
QVTSLTQTLNLSVVRPTAAAKSSPPASHRFLPLKETLIALVLRVGQDDRVHFNKKPPVKTAFKRRFKRTRRAVERVRYHRELSHGLNEITSWIIDGFESLLQRARSMGYAKENLICQERRAAAARGEAALKRALDLVQRERKHFSNRRRFHQLPEFDQGKRKKMMVPRGPNCRFCESVEDVVKVDTKE